MSYLHTDGADVFGTLRQFHSLPCCSCTYTAVKPALKLIELERVSLIAFWVYLLEVFIDPVGVCWRATLPAADCCCTVEWKQSRWWNRGQIGWWVKNTRIVFLKRQKNKSIDSFPFAFFQIYYLRVITHSYITSVFAQTFVLRHISLQSFPLQYSALLFNDSLLQSHFQCAICAHCICLNNF